MNATGYTQISQTKLYHSIMRMGAFPWQLSQAPTTPTVSFGGQNHQLVIKRSA